MSFRFAAVISHPIQHYAPVFRELAKTPGMSVKVFYCCDWGVKPTYDPGFGREFAWDVPLLEGYEHEFVPIRRPPRHHGFWEIDNPSIGRRLESFAPHAMWLHGYGQRSCWRALRWARGRSAVIHYGDSELIRPRALVRRALKRLIVTQFFRRCDAFITVGDNNERYYEHYGVPRSRMFRGACPIDVGRFRETVRRAGPSAREDIRRRLGIPDDAVVAVWSAKMIDLKRPGDLVEALARLPGAPLHALFLGDGPLRPSLEDRVRQQSLENRVHFAGFVNQAQIALMLAAGDLLAITSDRDAHPLAVAESLTVGHPIVASDRIGCIGPSDSARPGVNTLVYPVGDTQALAAALERLARDSELRARMSRASWDLAPSQDVGATVQAVLRAIRALWGRFASQWQDVPADFAAAAADQAAEALQAAVV
jgi:glycosyltransferase involved in cell wall biosynthesis